MDRLERVKEQLDRRGFLCHIAASAEEAKATALSLIGKGSVGAGGSVTVRELGLCDALAAQGNEVYWHWQDGGEMRYRALGADWYVCSANALTEDGCLVLTDGGGNRVAALSFGPRNALVIAGENKLVADLPSALARVKSAECAGRNGVRLGLKTPCATVGKCTDCSVPQRMCSVTAVFERPPKGFASFHVILVACQLGY